MQIRAGVGAGSFPASRLWTSRKISPARTRLNPLRAAMNDTAEKSSPLRDCEARLRVLKKPGLDALLPARDLFLQTLAQHLGKKRPTVEEDSVDDRLGLQKFG